MIDYDDVHGEVGYYPYRHALVSDVFLEQPRRLFDRLEVALIAKANANPQNHVVFALEQFGKDPIYIRFSDDRVQFARTIHEYPNGY